jgi:uncharacterized membrane protein (UPF0127 family)
VTAAGPGGDPPPGGELPGGRSRLGSVLLVVGAVLLVVALVGVVLLATEDEAGGPPPAGDAPATLAAALSGATPADAPFSGLTATRVRVGDRTLSVVVADAPDERVEGLRRRRDVGPYDGMLFVFPASTEGSFTMSSVPVALDIGFYDDAGRVVATRRMEPCARAESECPLYGATAPYRYALETPAGALPRGRLR